MPEAEIARLLQPFQHLGRDRGGCSEHHGLGLAIVQAIVTAHEGKIGVRPSLWGGLVIEVSIPLNDRSASRTETCCAGANRTI
jgi:signal transduction histidine kinase